MFNDIPAQSLHRLLDVRQKEVTKHDQQELLLSTVLCVFVGDSLRNPEDVTETCVLSPCLVICEALCTDCMNCYYSDHCEEYLPFCFQKTNTTYCCIQNEILKDF